MNDKKKRSQTDDQLAKTRKTLIAEMVELSRKLAGLSAPKTAGTSQETLAKEQRLQYGDEKFRKITDSFTDAVIMIDDSGSIVYWNKMAEKIFGYPSEKALGNHLDTLIVPEIYRKQFEKKLDELRRTDRSSFPGIKSEISALRKNGSQFPAEIHLTRLKLKGEKYALAVVRDNTENKRVDERLRVLFRAVEQSLVSIVITDNQGKIEYVNPMFTKVTGYPLDELVGQHTRVLRSGKQSMEFYQHLWETITSGNEWRGEFQNRKKNGKVYWEAATISPVTDSNGNITHYVALKEEITKRKETEQSLKTAKDTAEKANEAKSQFLSNMSHELRTPMNAILGFAQLLELDPSEPLSKTQKENLQQILKSGRHLLELINEVLDLSRIESGKLSISVGSVNACKMVEEAIALVEPMADEYDISIAEDRNNGDYCECCVMADNTRFKQALVNLLSNAIKYNTEGGSVTVSYQEIPEGFLRIKVIDTGQGIPLEKIPDLFEPFNRLGAECSDIEGSGIGLTITKRLMELMGGNVGIENQPEEGCCFYLDLLIDREKETQKSLESEAEQHKTRVLFVDDEPTNLQLFKSIFKHHSNVELLCATQGHTGIDLAKEHHPDLILLDINLSDLDGFKALEILKSSEETKDIPVIAVSGNAMANDIEKGLAAGFIHYITKPIDVVKFLEIVGNILKLELSCLGSVNRPSGEKE